MGVGCDCRKVSRKKMKEKEKKTGGEEIGSDSRKEKRGKAEEQEWERYRIQREINSE